MIENKLKKAVVDYFRRPKYLSFEHGTQRERGGREGVDADQVQSGGHAILADDVVLGREKWARGRQNDNGNNGFKLFRCITTDRRWRTQTNAKSI